MASKLTILRSAIEKFSGEGALPLGLSQTIPPAACCTVAYDYE